MLVIASSACFLKLCEDKLDMLSVLLKQIRVDDKVANVGYTEVIKVFP